MTLPTHEQVPTTYFLINRALFDNRGPEQTIGSSVSQVIIQLGTRIAIEEGSKIWKDFTRSWRESEIELKGEILALNCDFVVDENGKFRPEVMKIIDQDAQFLLPASKCKNAYQQQKLIKQSLFPQEIQRTESEKVPKKNKGEGSLFETLFEYQKEKQRNN